MAVKQQSGSHAADNVSRTNNQPVPATHVVIDPPYPPSNSQPPASDEKNQAPKGWRRFLQPDWVIVYVTVANALIAFFMWLAIRHQADLMERQSNEARESTTKAIAIARDAADATRIQATAAMGVAVPTLIVHSFTLNIDPDNVELFLRYPEFRIEVKNFGQSPAFLKDYAIEIAGGGHLADEPVYSEAWVSETEEVVSPGATRFLDNEGRCCPMHYPEGRLLNDLLSRQESMVVYGYVRYGDIFGSPLRTLKFCKMIAELPSKESRGLLIEWGGPKYTGQ